MKTNPEPLRVQWKIAIAAIWIEAILSLGWLLWRRRATMAATE